MELDIHGKQLDVGDALRQHITGKIEELTRKYFNHATSATVTLTKEGHGHGQFRATISVLVGKNIMIVTEDEATDPYAAFDCAADKAAKRLRRYKKKLRDHHQRVEKTPETEILKARDYVLAVQPEQDNEKEEDDGVPQGEDPVIIAEMTTDIQTMSVSDAVMRMDLSGQPAYLFRNASHNELNMVYRRPDGNVGWIDPAINNNAKKARRA